MSSITPLKFIDQVEKKPPATCLLGGEEIQLLEEARASVCRHFDSDSRRIIDIDKPHPSNEIASKSKSLFGDSSELFQCFCSGKPPENKLAFIKGLQKHIQPPDCLMIIILGWDYKYKKAAWFKNLSEQTPTVICDRLPAREAATWIGRWATQAQVTLSEPAVRFLSIQTEGNLFAAKQAIAKLALLTTSEQSPDKQAVRAALADGARYDILDLSDAIYAGNPARALDILRCLRADNVADTLIQWNVLNVLNNIAAVQSGGRVLAWGKQLAAVRMLAGKIDSNALHRLIQQAAHADRVAKGVAKGGDMENILCGIVARLAGRQSGVKIALPSYTRS